MLTRAWHDWICRAAFNPVYICHGIRLAPKPVEEVLRHAVIPVAGDIGKPNVLFRIVERIRSCPRATERFASFAVTLPEKAAA